MSGYIAERHDNVKIYTGHRGRSETAVDLVDHPGHIGGLDQAPTILGELAEAPCYGAQRLGYNAGNRITSAYTLHRDPVTG